MIKQETMVQNGTLDIRQKHGVLEIYGMKQDIDKITRRG